MGKKRAYVSVFNKRRIEEFCRYLVEYGYELVASEGTCRALKAAGVPVLSVHELSGYPEPLGGAVRGVDPAIYTGIISAQLTEEQLAALDEEVVPIELVVVNFYPFGRDMEQGVPFETCASHIDAGGIALLTAAAKNFRNTVVICDIDDYDRALCALAAGEFSEEERKYFMYKAFSYAAGYQALVSQYLSRGIPGFPKTITFTYEKAQEVRYGENPHQKAAIYREPLLKEGSLARAKQLRGGALTFNCVEDCNTALELVKEFEGPAAVVCKHRAVCAAGAGEDVYEALSHAISADVSAFSHGIVAVNAVLDARACSLLRDLSAEAVLAVGFTPEAREELRFCKDLILLEMPDIRSKVQFSASDLKKIYGGLLVQTYDTALFDEARCVSKRLPTDAERRALGLCYRVVKHVRSSGIVVGGEHETYGIGTEAGREAAANSALRSAGERARGAVFASDAGLGQRSLLEQCAEKGITAVIATAANKEQIALCDKYSIALLVTGYRHFKN